MPTPQLSAAKSSLLGYVQMKTESSQTFVFKTRPGICFYHAREHPARCADTISPGAFHLGMEANTDFFYLVGLEHYLLKYNGCQLATVENEDTFTQHTTTV